MPADVATFMALSPGPFDACDKAVISVSSHACIYYKYNVYPASARYGYQDVLAKE